MNIVVPMAGRGQRFVEAGYTVPKPLIDVRGRPMYTWAVDSLPLDQGARLVFVALQEHLERGLAEDIARRYHDHDPALVAVERTTDGQACTVLLAREVIDDDQPLLVHNADTMFRSDLAPRLRSLPVDVDGLIGVFEAEGEHWSFARADGDGRVVETAEKVRISPWATTGLYHFSRGRDFVRHADAMVAEDDRTRGEFYVAPVYNRMIAEGAQVILDVAEEVWVMGTPAELSRFESSYPGA